MKRRLAAWIAFVFFAVLPTVAHAARKPWRRRPGVVLYQWKSGVPMAQRAHAMQVVAAATAAPRDEEDIAADLLKSGAVDYAEPDYLMPVAAVPNDPGYSSQWYHDAIHTPTAWDSTTGAAGVTVAVCDTGVDATQPDLIGNMALPGYNAVDSSTDTTPVADHGTAVAGIIGALGDNHQGIAGVAWHVKVLPVRVSDYPDGSAWCSDMANGVQWAADHGAKVINLSYDITGCPNTMNAAAQYAKDKGALTFIAAGNSGTPLAGSFPTTHAFVLVGATDSNNAAASFSNYGPAIDVMAPGVSIYAPLPGNSYAYGTGTSFASPMAAGVAALLASLNTGWTPDQLRTLMLASAHYTGRVQDGYGLIDAGAAVTTANHVLAGGAWPTLEAPGGTTAASDGALDKVLVYPNPWRNDRHGAGTPIVLSGLTDNATVKLFTVSGYLIRTLTASDGKVTWDLKNDSGDPAASGLYIYSITDSQNHQQQGKLSIIR